MTIAAAQIIISGGNKTSETSHITSALAASAAIGDLVIVAIAADNAGTSGVSSITAPQDSQGNNYTLIKEQNRTAGSAAADGCTASLYGSVLTTALTSGVDTVTLNFSPATIAKAWTGIKVTGANTTTYSTGNNSGSGATYTSNASASMASGDLFVGVVANESGTAPASDSDSTNGSWSSLNTTSGGTGGDATKMGINLQWKVTTGSGTQTLDAATGASTDWALVYALYTVASSGNSVSIDGHGDAATVGAGSVQALLAAAGKGTAAAVTGSASSKLTAVLAASGPSASVGAGSAVLAAVLTGKGTAAAGVTGINYDPMNLAVQIAGSTATLTWDASQTPGVTTYTVFRRSPPTGVVFNPAVNTPVTTTATSPYVDTGLATATYEWQVFGNVP